MTGCGINDDDVLALSEGLKVNTTLTSLNLGCRGEWIWEKERKNRIKQWFWETASRIKEGGKELCEALKGNTSLRELNLECEKRS